MGRSKILCHAVFGKRAQLIRIGAKLALQHLEDAHSDLCKCSSSQIKSAVAATFQTALEQIELLATLRLRDVSKKPVEQIAHEAVYSANSFRPLRGPHAARVRVYRHASDGDYVRNCRGKQRQHLQKLILSEVQIACLPNAIGELRRELLKRLGAIDVSELYERQAAGYTRRGQKFITLTTERHRRSSLIELLGVEFPFWTDLLTFYRENNAFITTERDVSRNAVREYVYGYKERITGSVRLLVARLEAPERTISPLAADAIEFAIAQYSSGEWNVETYETLSGDLLPLPPAQNKISTPSI